MRNFSAYRLFYVFAASLSLLSVRSDAADDPNVCDVRILNRAGCEVGDFDRAKKGPWPRARPKPLPAEMLRSFEAPKLPELKDEKYKEAIGSLELSVEAQPRNSKYRSALCDAYVRYGNFLKAHGDPKGAAAQYLKALNERKKASEP